MVYDIVYYKDGLGQEAIKHLKRLPRSEQIERRLAIGVHLCNTKKFPNSNAIGKQIMRAIHGGVWLMDAERVNSYQYTVIKGTEAAPEIVGGVLDPKVLEDPVYLQEAQNSVMTEEKRDEQLAKLKSTLTTTVTQTSENASYRYKVMVAHLAGVKNPGKIPLTELNDIVDGIILTGEVAIPSLERWFQVHCSQVETINNEVKRLETPFEIGDDADFERICAAVRSGQ